MLENPLVPLPETGRVFRARRTVRLADASPSQRLRLDACARYLQDVGNDDTAESGLDDAVAGGVWVVRRAVVDLLALPRWNESVELATWCAGTGGRWAERRLSITGQVDGGSAADAGSQVEITTLWVHLDRATLLPARLPAAFHEIYGEAAQGRKVSARQWLGAPPDGEDHLQLVPWPLRAVDFDVMSHVNNAAYWAAVEEVLAAHRDHPAHPSQGTPVRAVLEFGSGIDRDAQVELLVRRDDKQLDIWFTEDGTTHATACVFPLRLRN